MDFNTKKRFKMYKAGKRWIYAPVVFLTIGSGVLLGGVTVHADNVVGEVSAAVVPTSTANSAASVAPTSTANSVASVAPTSTANSAASVTPTSMASSAASVTPTSTASSAASVAPKSTAGSVASVAVKTPTIKPNTVANTSALNIKPELKTVVRAAQVAEGNQIHVTKDNFLDYFQLNGVASYDKSTGIITLTPDVKNPGVVGSATLSALKILMSQNLTLKGQVYLGAHDGADGESFFFHDGPTSQIGGAGNGFGLAGLVNAFGFKLDTFSNSDEQNKNNGGYAADSKLPGGGRAPFGGYVYTDSTNTVNSYNGSDAPIQQINQPRGEWLDVNVQYDGLSHIMTVQVTSPKPFPNGQTTLTWTKDISTWSDPQKAYAFGLIASTGSYSNTQQFKFESFDFTSQGTVNYRFISPDGKDIAKSNQVDAPINQEHDITNDNVTTLQTLKNQGWIINPQGPTASNPANFDGTNVLIDQNGNTITYTFTKDYTNAATVTQATQNVHYQDNNGNPIKDNSGTIIPDSSQKINILTVTDPITKAQTFYYAPAPTDGSKPVVTLDANGIPTDSIWQLAPSTGVQTNSVNVPHVDNYGTAYMINGGTSVPVNHNVPAQKINPATDQTINVVVTYTPLAQPIIIGSVQTSNITYNYLMSKGGQAVDVNKNSIPKVTKTFDTITVTDKNGNTFTYYKIRADGDTNQATAPTFDPTTGLPTDASWQRLNSDGIVTQNQGVPTAATFDAGKVQQYNTAAYSVNVNQPGAVDQGMIPNGGITAIQIVPGKNTNVNIVYYIVEKTHLKVTYVDSTGKQAVDANGKPIQDVHQYIYTININGNHYQSTTDPSVAITNEQLANVNVTTPQTAYDGWQKVANATMAPVSVPKVPNTTTRYNVNNAGNTPMSGDISSLPFGFNTDNKIVVTYYTPTYTNGVVTQNTQTIHYQDAAGNPVKDAQGNVIPDNIQYVNTVTVTKTDPVTGYTTTANYYQITNNGDVPTGPTFDPKTGLPTDSSWQAMTGTTVNTNSVVSPTVTGMTPDQVTVPASVITPGPATNSTTTTVTYTKDNPTYSTEVSQTTQTIHYQDAAGNPVKDAQGNVIPDQVQYVNVVTVTATDPVTGEKTTTTYYQPVTTDKTMPSAPSLDANGVPTDSSWQVVPTTGIPTTAVTSPTVTGMTPDNSSVPAGTLTPGNSTTTTVTYTKDVPTPHKIVPVGPSNPQVPGTPINPSNPNGPKWPAGTDKASLVQTSTRTINYVDQNGKVIAPAVIQTVTYGQTALVDTVTGEIIGYDTNGDGQVDTIDGTKPWIAIGGNTWDSVASPDLSKAGYTNPSIAIVNGQVVAFNTPATIITVVYANDPDTNNQDDNNDGTDTNNQDDIIMEITIIMVMVIPIMANLSTIQLL